MNTSVRCIWPARKDGAGRCRVFEKAHQSLQCARWMWESFRLSGGASQSSELTSEEARTSDFMACCCSSSKDRHIIALNEIYWLNSICVTDRSSIRLEIVGINATRNASLRMLRESDRVVQHHDDVKEI